MAYDPACDPSAAGAPMPGAAPNYYAAPGQPWWFVPFANFVMPFVAVKD